jgi:hypothetical protein
LELWLPVVSVLGRWAAGTTLLLMMRMLATLLLYLLYLWHCQLPVVVGVAAAGMAMFKVIGNDDNDVVVTKTAVVVIATVSTTRTAARQLFLVFLKYFISLPARRQRIKELLFIQ